MVGLDRSYFPITKFSIEQSDGITSISEDLRRQTVEVFGVENEIRVINNFINADLYRPSQGNSAEPPRLVHISNFRPVKRVFDCLYILAEVRKRIPAQLYMIGDGPDRGPAQRLTRELGLESHVVFMGKQDHVERLIPQNHVLLLPSEMESFGLAALEGMACGLPVVATQAGGLPELVTHGLNGFLAPVGDTAGQAAHVVNLLSDRALYERMSTAARRAAVDRFSTDLIIPQYERYYADVLARP